MCTPQFLLNKIELIDELAGEILGLVDASLIETDSSYTLYSKLERINSYRDWDRISVDAESIFIRL